MTLYLASSSPRRIQLIKLLGAPHVVVRSRDVDESFEPSIPPDIIVRSLAIRKAQAIRSGLIAEGKSGIIVGADTIVVLDGEVLGKPTDTDDAKRMLRLLSGNTHTVYTGLVLFHAITGLHHSFYEATEVTFRTLGDSEIDDYVASGSPMDKAGAYGIQDDHGAVFISKIVGDYYNVVGLPLCRLYIELSKFAPNIFKK